MKNAQSYILQTPPDSQFQMSSQIITKLKAQSASMAKQIDINSEAQYFNNNLSSKNDNFNSNNRLSNKLVNSSKKKKKSKNAKQEEIMTKITKKPNYFQKMYKQTEKKMYINIFIRKIKQIITKSQNFSHPLLQHTKNPKIMSQFKTYLLNPRFQIIYSFVQILITFVTCIYSTMILPFPEIQFTIFYKVCSLLTCLCILAEMVLNIFTRSSFNIHSEKLNNFLYVREAFSCYFNSRWLIVDAYLFVVFFVDVVTTFEYIHIIKLLFLFKLYQVIDKIRNLQILFISNCFKQQFWQLIKIFLFNFLLAHIIAVVLLLMTRLKTDTQKTWLNQKNLQFSTAWFQKYIWAHYWATTIMFTVGFGDLVPTNVNQVIIMIFIQSICCIVLAYNIARVGQIFNKIASYQLQKIDNLKTFTQMQLKQQFSEDIKKKITNYIIQSAQLKRKFNVNQQNSLVNKLPKTFYEQLKKQSTSKIFGSIPFFRNLKLSKLQELAIRIDKKLTHPQEIIVQAGTIPEIYILNSGHVSYNVNRLGLKSHGKQISAFKIQENQYKILSMYFFIRKPINYDIKCKDYTILYSINKKELQILLSTNPYCFEYYSMYKDKDQFNTSDWWQTNKCDICNNNSRHTYFQCPKLHFIPMKSIVIARALKNKPKFVQKMNVRRRRISRQTVNSLRYYSQIERIFKKIQIEKKVKQFIKKSNKHVKWQTLQQDYFYDQDSKLYLDNVQQSIAPIKRQASRKSFPIEIMLSSSKANKLKQLDHIIQKRKQVEKSLEEVQICQKTVSSLQLQTMIKIHYLKQLRNKIIASRSECRKTKQHNLQTQSTQYRQKRSPAKTPKLVLKPPQKSFQEICHQISEKLKQQLAKNNHCNVNNNDSKWDFQLGLDIAHDYGFYFQNDNPSMLRKRWRKRLVERNLIKYGGFGI